MSRTLPTAIGGVTVVDVTIGSGKTVATLQAFWEWVYTNYPNLISADRIVRGLVTGELQRDSASITIGGTIVGDATRYVILTADAGQSVCDGPASSTPIRYSTSHARLVGTDAYAVPCPIPDITCKVIIEALQFGFTGVGDATLINAPAGVDLHTRSNIFYDTLGVDCIKYRKSLRSFNDVFLVDASDYIHTKCYVPIEADASDYASEIHNPTLLSGSTYVTGGLGDLGNAETASDSLACNMLHLGGGNLSLGSDWNATHGLSPIHI